MGGVEGGAKQFEMRDVDRSRAAQAQGVWKWCKLHITPGKLSLRKQ